MINAYMEPDNEVSAYSVDPISCFLSTNDPDSSRSLPHVLFSLQGIALRIRETFKRIDVDQSGTISMDELIGGLQDLLQEDAPSVLEVSIVLERAWLFLLSPQCAVLLAPPCLLFWGREGGRLLNASHALCSSCHRISVCVHNPVLLLKFALAFPSVYFSGWEFLDHPVDGRH